jgi:hypothetical protein
MVILSERPARALELARRLRLDPGPISRTLARLEEQGVVRRASPSRFTEWNLEPEGAMRLELLDIGWVGVNESVRSQLGDQLPSSLVRVVDHLRYPVPREHQGWSDD